MKTMQVGELKAHFSEILGMTAKSAFPTAEVKKPWPYWYPMTNTGIKRNVNSASSAARDP
jgi:hypothetical protein